MSSKLRGPASPLFFVPVLASLVVLGLAVPPNRSASSCDEVAFVARAGGVPAEGTVQNYKTDVQFDPGAPEQASLRLIFDMRSTSTGSSMADRAALSEEFLDAERYPTAELTAKGAKPAGEGKYLMEGLLTLKGVTKPIQLPVSIKITEGNKAALRGETTVNRFDFGVGPESYMGLILDKDVKVRVALSDIALKEPSPQTPAQSPDPNPAPKNR